MLVRHEVKCVWHTGSETCAVSYSRYEDDELADRHVIDQVPSCAVPRAAQEFAAFVRPTLFTDARPGEDLPASGGVRSPGSHPWSEAEHARAAQHYRRQADLAREQAGLPPFPD